MRPRHLLLVASASLVAALVGTSCAYEYKAQVSSARLWEKVHTAAVTGAPREQVVRSLESENLPFAYSARSRAIISPWIPVGRYRLFWETQFFYQIDFDNADRVVGFKTERFNEGL